MKTEQELRNSTDWDMLEFDLGIDIDQLVNWYNDVTVGLADLKFNLSMSELITSNHKPSDDVRIVSQGIHSWGMSWPVEQSLPIPPKFAARLDLYPEVDLVDFEQRMKVMARYKFGYFNHLLNTLGEETFSWSRITVHDAGASIGTHTDGPHTIRMHIPIVTNDDAWFCWGDNRYNFKPGCAYLINTSIPHSTVNSGTTTRAHIISHPTNVAWLLGHLN